MNIIAQKTETVAIDAVRPHPENPRRGDLEVIKESIQVNGFYNPLIAQRSTGYILAGNHRHRAASELGFTEVPVTWVDVDDDAALNILLVDNRSSDLGDYDNDKLMALLQGRSEVDEELSGTGYDNAFLVGLLKSSEGPGETGGGGSGSRGSSGPSSPPADPGPPPEPPSGNGYREQYGVMVICEDEDEQKDVFDSLKKSDYNVRLWTG